ncbi:polysaccharide biosynthesis tyrosine autokinase [Cupriavidus sp. CuC1]|uniref:polysaccharide biosynthesis tyrosine autokinase n=1 Tax=Cupriavidus sp. CuC1 TaxID=3373131 RepID=UPI0037CFA93D
MNIISQQTSSNIGHNEIELGAYLDSLVANRWLIGILTAVSLALGGLYTIVATPIYQADIMLQVEDNSEAATGNLVANVSSLFETKSVTAGEIEIIRSRLVVARAVDNLKLYISVTPQYFPVVGRWIAKQRHSVSRSGFFEMGGFAWGPEAASVAKFDVPNVMEGKPFTLTVLPANRYRLTGPDADMKFEGRVGQAELFPTASGEVQLTVTSLKGEPGVNFVVVRHSRLGVIEQIQSSLKILEKGKQQSGVIGATLEGANPAAISLILNEIGGEYVQQNIERKSAEAAKSLEFLDVQLPKMKTALERAEQSYTTLRKERGSVDVSGEAKLALQLSVEAQSQLFALKQKREELVKRFASSHPSLLTVDEQISALQEQIASADKRIRQLPTLEQDIVRKERDVRVSNDLYIAMLQSAQQLSLIKAGKVGNVRVVDAAVTPQVPIKPIRPLVLVISGVAGLIVGIAAAFARNMLFGGITDPHEIEQYTGLSVYATIPFSDQQKELAKQIHAKGKNILVLAQTHPHEPAIESLRSFRTALQFAMLEARNNIVILTGPSPGVGKSFVSANFAVVMASAGKRVLLIDADVRKGYLNQYFGLGRDKGLSELIVGTTDLESAIHKLPIANLEFMSTGSLPPNPAELLLNPRVSELLEELSRQYDYIVLDTPPVLAAADAAILAPLAGAAFLVALADTTKAGEIVEASRRLGQSGVQVKGVLFNGVKPHSGRYGYGAKYGSYRYIAYQYEPNKG